MRKTKHQEHEQYKERMHFNEECICPLCGRDIPQSQRDEHHLVPRSKKGKETQTLHRACHRQIHMLFTENELASVYNSPEALLEHPDIQKFVAWIATKPNDFLPQFSSSNRKKNK